MGPLDVVYLALPAVVLVFSLFLAVLVAGSDWRSPLHRIFGAFLIAMALWGLTIFGMRTSPDLAAAYQWEKWALAVIPFVSILFYHFTVWFTGYWGAPWVLRGFYALGLMDGVLALLGLVAVGMQRKFYGYAPVLGPAFPLYLVAAYAPTVLALAVLVRTYRRATSSLEKERIAYVMLGAASSVVGATTDFLPALGVHLYPLGIVSNIFFGALSTAAIVQDRLLNLRLALRRGLAYSFVSSAALMVYGGVFLLFWSAFRQRTAAASVVATVVALLVATMLLPPALSRVQRFVDRRFFRERYDHLLALQGFAQETRDLAGFSSLASSLTKTVQMAMQADWVATLLVSAEGDRFEVVSSTLPTGSPEITIQERSLLVRWLGRNRRALDIRELERDPYLVAIDDAERQLLDRSGVQLLVPLSVKDKVTGILLLGPKLSERDYSAEDAELLITVANQAATLVENSRLYSQEMARLRELEQLEGLKSNLLRTVSHELKSPLTAVKASADLLFQSKDLAERERARLTRSLQSGVTRLERLVQESLDYAQMQSAQLDLRMELADYRPVLEEAIGLTNASFQRKHQQLTVAVPETLPRLVLDRTRLERILVNILSNATNFTPGGGAIALRVWKDGAYVVTEISDNGPGIPEEDLPLIFNEYYRGSRADARQGSGTGLGLSIAKYLVELHGGSIQVRSKAGEGASFSFTLPIRGPEAPEAQPGAGT